MRSRSQRTKRTVEMLQESGLAWRVLATPPSGSPIRWTVRSPVRRNRATLKSCNLLIKKVKALDGQFDRLRSPSSMSEDLTLTCDLHQKKHVLSLQYTHSPYCSASDRDRPNRCLEPSRRQDCPTRSIFPRGLSHTPHPQLTGNCRSLSPTDSRLGPTQKMTDS